jgi:hypothetical protein
MAVGLSGVGDICGALLLETVVTKSGSCRRIILFDSYLVGVTPPSHQSAAHCSGSIYVPSPYRLGLGDVLRDKCLLVSLAGSALAVDIVGHLSAVGRGDDVSDVAADLFLVFYGETESAVGKFKNGMHIVFIDR